MTILPNTTNRTKGTPDQRHAQIQEQAQKWVAQTFYGTLLKQMRQSPFRSKLFDGGRGGEVFSQLSDQRMVDHFAKGAGGKKLVSAITKHIEKSLKKPSGGDHVSITA